MPAIAFRVMSWLINIRNRKHPPKEILQETGIKPGFRVLDYGCGPGGHSIAAAELVGEQGRVYALDIHPLALEAVEKAAAEKHLANIETIQSACATGLDAESLDMVMLYDIFHMLRNQKEVLREVLRELHRVLKLGAILSVDDHHMKAEDVVSGVTNTALFELSAKGKKTFSFLKVNDGGNGGK
jgi:ubiquinone/menaquinone biosynthesis C-methylase UbiE